MKQNIKEIEEAVDWYKHCLVELVKLEGKEEDIKKEKIKWRNNLQLAKQELLSVRLN